jgi:hypothetical protein
VRGQRTIVATTAGAFALAVVLAAMVPWHQVAWWALPALTVAVVFAESVATRLVIGRQGFTFGLTDALLVAALALSPGMWIAAAVTVGVTVVFSRRRRQRVKLAFNISNFACSTAVAVAVTSWLGGGVLPAAIGVLSFAVANHMLTALAVSAATGRSYHLVLVDTALIGVLSTGGNASIGLLGAWLAVNQPLGLLGLVVPVGLLWWSYLQQTERTAESRLFAEIARGQETIAGTSVDTSAQVVVTAAARVFGGAEVEMLLRHPEGLVRYVGDENGIALRSRTDSDAFGTPWVLRALGARGPLTGIEGDRPFTSAVLGDVDRPLAVFIVRRPPRAGAFTRSDERLASLLVAQAESWLSVADLSAQADEARGEVEVYRAAGRVLSDIGADTAPALVVLRESSDRLARLANRFDGPDPVSQIVDELHAVERAVASLLGAIALAQPAPEAAPRAEPVWTTTGRLEPADGR